MRPGCVFCDFTPIDPEKSAELEEIYTKWLQGDPAYKRWKFCRTSTEEALHAGHVDAGWYESFFATVSDEMRETRLRGAFANYEGVIYQSFNAAIHLMPDDHPRDERGYIKIPRGCFHRRAIDWGASAEHPFVCLWAARNGIGQYFIYDEYWNDSQNVTSLDHASEIRERHEWPPDSYHGSTYGDPSRPDQLSLFNTLGIPMQAARNDVHPGIERVRELLKIQDGTGEPRLFIDPANCPKLVKEIRTYRWKRRSGQGVNPAAAKPEPLKWQDDCVDALRYLLMTDRSDNETPQGKRRRPEAQRLGVQIAGANGKDWNRSNGNGRH